MILQPPDQLFSTGSISMLVLSAIGLVPVAFCSRALARMSGVPAEFLPSAASLSIAVLSSIYVVSNFGAGYGSNDYGRTPR